MSLYTASFLAFVITDKLNTVIPLKPSVLIPFFPLSYFLSVFIIFTFALNIFSSPICCFTVSLQIFVHLIWHCYMETLKEVTSDLTTSATDRPQWKIGVFRQKDQVLFVSATYGSCVDCTCLCFSVFVCIYYACKYTVHFRQILCCMCEVRLCCSVTRMSRCNGNSSLVMWLGGMVPTKWWDDGNCACHSVLHTITRKYTSWSFKWKGWVSSQECELTVKLDRLMNQLVNALNKPLFKGQFHLLPIVLVWRVHVHYQPTVLTHI